MKLNRNTNINFTLETISSADEPSELLGIEVKDLVLTIHTPDGPQSFEVPDECVSITPKATFHCSGYFFPADIDTAPSTDVPAVS